MSPFRHIETGQVLPVGQTPIAKDATFVQPITFPDNKALAVFEDARVQRIKDGQVVSSQSPTIKLEGREGEQTVIVTPSREVVVLDWKPTIEVQAEKKLKEWKEKRYFPFSNQIFDLGIRYYKKNGLKNAKDYLVQGLNLCSSLGVGVLEHFAFFPLRVYDLITDRWHEEEAKIIAELKEKKGRE